MAQNVIDKREHPRAPVEAEILISNGVKDNPACTADVSPGGARIYYVVEGKPIPLNTKIRIDSKALGLRNQQALAVWEKRAFMDTYLYGLKYI